MTKLKHFVVIGLIGVLAGCAGNITVKMPEKNTESIPLTLLAKVEVNDLRKPGVAASKREAAFGVPMGTVEFDPPEDQYIKKLLETELTKLLIEAGVGSTKKYVVDLVEFGVNTDTTPLYWDVVARVHLILKSGENKYDLVGTHTERTYIWPGEEIIRQAINKSLEQIIIELKQVTVR